MRFERMNDHFVKLHCGDGTVYHHFTAADGPRADFHDHGQWGFWSEVLEGGYTEQVLLFHKNGYVVVKEMTRLPGDKFFVTHDHIHRIVRLLEPSCYTHVTPSAHRGVRENWYRLNEQGKIFTCWTGGREYEQAIQPFNSLEWI